MALSRNRIGHHPQPEGLGSGDGRRAVSQAQQRFGRQRSRQLPFSPRCCAITGKLPWLGELPLWSETEATTRTNSLDRTVDNQVPAGRRTRHGKTRGHSRQGFAWLGGPGMNKTVSAPRVYAHSLCPAHQRRNRCAFAALRFSRCNRPRLSWVHGQPSPRTTAGGLSRTELQCIGGVITRDCAAPFRRVGGATR